MWLGGTTANIYNFYQWWRKKPDFHVSMYSFKNHISQVQVLLFVNYNLISCKTNLRKGLDEIIIHMETNNVPDNVIY